MKKLDKIFQKAKRISINNNSKIVIMSDCHRGSGDTDDNFLKNRNVFEGALVYYYNRGFTYVELGDGDELWEVKNFKDIIIEHLSTFKTLRKFYKKNRFIMIYGNHDMDKKNQSVMDKYFYKYYNKLTKKEEELLDGLKVYESLVLDYNGYEIFMLHGHQADFLNSNLWKLSRFLVRHVWRNLEKIGIKDPTSAAKNYRVSNLTEKKLKKWSNKNNKMLIAGHTHRPIFPNKDDSLYFNDGSCIHPNGVTCLEIENGKITLVKWEYKINGNETINVGKNIIDGGIDIASFFDN